MRKTLAAAGLGALLLTGGPIVLPANAPVAFFAATPVQAQAQNWCKTDCETACNSRRPGVSKEMCTGPQGKNCAQYPTSPCRGRSAADAFGKQWKKENIR